MVLAETIPLKAIGQALYTHGHFAPFNGDLHRITIDGEKGEIALLNLSGLLTSIEAIQLTIIYNQSFQWYDLYGKVQYHPEFRVYRSDWYQHKSPCQILLGRDPTPSKLGEFSEIDELQNLAEFFARHTDIQIGKRGIQEAIHIIHQQTDIVNVRKIVLQVKVHWKYLQKEWAQGWIQFDPLQNELLIGYKEGASYSPHYALHLTRFNTYLHTYVGWTKALLPSDPNGYWSWNWIKAQFQKALHPRIEVVDDELLVRGMLHTYLINKTERVYLHDSQKSINIKRFPSDQDVRYITQSNLNDLPKIVQQQRLQRIKLVHLLLHDQEYARNDIEFSDQIYGN